MKPFELSAHLLNELVSVARKSTCTRSKCGSIIVFQETEEIIGVGYNSMPCNNVGACTKDLTKPEFPSDRTCCVHAEQRAIMDALKRNPEMIQGSKLIFLRLDDQGNPIPATKIYCTICSKLALDAGISLFCLFTPTGWVAYQADDYNVLSFLQAELPVSEKIQDLLANTQLT